MEFHCSCGKKQTKPANPKFFFNEPEPTTKSYKPVQKYVPPKKKWIPPTIYQRSYMPVKSDVVIAGPPESDWRRPREELSGVTTYIHDYGQTRQPKWYHHAHETPKPEKTVKISEYAERFGPLSEKAWKKATAREPVRAKVLAKTSSGFDKMALKPAMADETVYMEHFQSPDKQVTGFELSPCDFGATL